jgi:hypothetical protein
VNSFLILKRIRQFIHLASIKIILLSNLINQRGDQSQIYNVRLDKKMDGDGSAGSIGLVQYDPFFQDKPRH